MKFSVSTELIPNRSVTWKKLADGVPEQQSNYTSTGSSDGSGSGGANPSDFVSIKSTIRLQSGGTDILAYPATVWGYNATSEGGFVAKWAEFKTGFGNTRARLILAKYEGETGNVVIDSCKNSATVQKLVVSGSPTGGTFTLTWNGQTTGNIAYNASAGTVQTALSGLTGLLGTVTVTGGSLPANTLTITYSNTGNVNVLTTASALTGGTAPKSSVSVATWSNGATYFASGGIIFPTGTEAQRGYVEYPWIWSGKQQAIVAIRTAEKTARNRTQIVAGRIRLFRNDALVPTLYAQWVDYNGPATGTCIADAGFPTGAVNTQTIGGAVSTLPDVEPTGWNDSSTINFALPALVLRLTAGHHECAVTFGSQQYVSHAMAKPWAYNDTDPSDHWYDVSVPIDQQLNAPPAAAQKNSFMFYVSKFDMQTLAATVTVGALGVATAVTFTNRNIYARQSTVADLDIVYVDVLAFLEMKGEDTTTA